MKKFVLIMMGILISIYSFSQAKKPAIMVVPSDFWCIENGFYDSYDNQGTATKIANYKKAFQNNSDILNVISKINGLMAERGFPLKNLESVLKLLESESAEDAMMTSKQGSGLAESNLEKLKRTAKADIIMQLTWKINRQGINKSVTFNLQGIDAYSSKQVATAQGTGSQSASAELIVMLEEAVLAHLDKFNSDLQSHFDDMFKNGREIVISIKKFDSWDGDLEKEYNGQELGAIIEDWLSKNTVNGRFGAPDVSTNKMKIEQVRIPLYDEGGRPIDARGFCKKLQKFLQEAPYSIVNKLTNKGLGEVTIILGEK